MVHALRDACRVTIAAGLLLDVRPFSDIRPLDVVPASGTDAMTIARVDTTGRAATDEAVDAAVGKLVQEGWLEERVRMAFEMDIQADTTEEFSRMRRRGAA